MNQGRNLTGDNPVTAGACRSPTSARAAATPNQAGAASPAGESRASDDLRQGVSREEHAVMDRADALAAPTFLMEPIDHLGIAQGLVAQAILGTGERRGHHAVDAAAHLLLFLEKSA